MQTTTMVAAATQLTSTTPEGDTPDNLKARLSGTSRLTGDSKPPLAFEMNVYIVEKLEVMNRRRKEAERNECVDWKEESQTRCFV